MADSHHFPFAKPYRCPDCGRGVAFRSPPHTLRRTLARLQRPQHESGKSRKLESGTASRTGTPVEGNRVAKRAHCGIQRRHREAGAGELSAGGAAEANQGCRYAGRADLPADAGRSASLPQKLRRGLLPGTAAGTRKLRAERATAAYQQRRRPFLRTLLVQGAQHILGPFGPDCDLMRWGLKLAERGGKGGKKRAIVATARRLAELLHHLWASGEVYEPLHERSRFSRLLQSRLIDGLRRQALEELLKIHNSWVEASPCSVFRLDRGAVTYSSFPAAGPTAVTCLVLGSMPISATPPTPPRLTVTMWPRALKSAFTSSGRVLGTERLPRLARS
jgi:hypothetical protein